MSEVPRIGIIAAQHSRCIATTLRRLETEGLCTLAAICRTDNKRFSELYEGMRDEGLPSHHALHFPDVMSMFEQTTLDGVVIASAPESHYDHAMYALSAGCNVYLQPPLMWNADFTPDENAERGEDIVTLARTAGKRITGGTHLCAWFCGTNGAYPVIEKHKESDIAVLHVKHGDGSGVPVLHQMVELLPHTYHVLRFIAGPGRLLFEADPAQNGTTRTFVAPFCQPKDAKTERNSDYQLIVTARYKRQGMDDVQIRALLDTATASPPETAHGRKDMYLDISINDQTISRKTQTRPFQVWLSNGNVETKVTDPLYASLRSFVTGGRIVDEEQLLDGHRMLCDTMNAHKMYLNRQQ